MKQKMDLFKNGSEKVICWGTCYTGNDAKKVPAYWM